MHLSLVIASLLGAASAASLPSSSPAPQSRYCGTYVDYQQVLTAEAKFRESKQTVETLVPAHLEIDCTQGASIPVAFHVLHENKTTAGGYLSDHAIQRSMEVLSDAFSGAGIKFKLINVTRTEDLSWFSDSVPDSYTELYMKTALRNGGVNTLNIYSAGLYVSLFELIGLIGYSNFPQDYATNPILDGVVIQYLTVPGGTNVEFNQGHTLVHEVGHWMGLHHPFESGCDAGDFVDDTPAASDGTLGGCPIGLDSCVGPEYPGLDPIHNFMSNTDDACSTEFTPGQFDRIRDQLLFYRNIRI